MNNETAYSQMMEAMKTARLRIPFVTNRDNARQLHSLLGMLRSEIAKRHGFEKISAHTSFNKSPKY